jgi:hypothetical protein
VAIAWSNVRGASHRPTAAFVGEIPKQGHLPLRNVVRSWFLLEFVEAEKLFGFHAPDEALRILGESINFARNNLSCDRRNRRRTSMPRSADRWLASRRLRTIGRSVMIMVVPGARES